MNFAQMLREAWHDTKSFFSSPKVFWSEQRAAFYGLIGAMLLELSVLLLILGAVGVRLGWPSALGILGVALLVLVVAFLVSLWRAIAGGRSYPLLSAIFAALLLLVPIFHAGRAAGLPPIHDISTDLKNPPRFIEIKKLRPPHANSLERKAWQDRKQRKALIAKQRQAYPNVKTLRFRNINGGRVFSAARAVAYLQGWEVVAAHPRRGLIEATDSSSLMGFKDDIVIRVRERKRSQNSVNVDVRSVSRLGRSDLGANARRVVVFLTDLKAEVKKARKRAKRVKK